MLAGMAVLAALLLTSPQLYYFSVTSPYFLGGYWIVVKRAIYCYDGYHASNNPKRLLTELNSSCVYFF